jgi:hypothetical protein
MLVTGSNAGDFSLTHTCGASLFAGANCTASVTFTPSARGSRTASMTITDNATGSPQTVGLTGTGTAPLVSLSPTSLTFGSQAVGTSSTPQSITLSNTGNSPLSITRLAVTGANASDFAETDNCGSSVAAGGKCSIDVTFIPKASGTRSGAITITGDADGSPQAVAVTGTGTGKGAIILPLKASSNGRYLVDQSGTPFLLMGEAPQSILGNLPASDMANYMADRQGRGFNALWVNLLCTTYTACGSSGTAYDNTAPFLTGSDPSNYDLSTPNSAYFAEVDAMLNLAVAHGLVVFLDPIETGGWLVTLQNNGTTKAYNYGVYLGNRYKSFTNIVWFSGNDFQTWNSSSTDNDLVHQVMRGIASGDTNHLQAVELNSNFSYGNQDTALSDVQTLDSSYTYGETYDETLQAYASSPTTPVFLAEANYEYENDTSSLPGPTGVYVLREQAYWTILSGGTGQIYGSHYTWTFNSGWQSYLDSPGALEIQYINKLFDSIKWWNLVPDLPHQVVTAGYGTYNGSNLDLTSASYCATGFDRSTLAVTYCPNSTTLTVDMAVFNSMVTAQWYDPSNGNYLSINGSPFPNIGSQAFTLPGSNNDGDPDWVLVLHTTGTGPK